MGYKCPIKKQQYNNAWRRMKYATDVEYRTKRLRYNWATYLKSKYGITPEEYEKKLREQKRKCLICGHKSPRFPTYKTMLCLDHDHQNGNIRGFLCGKCNKGLGHFLDSADLLEKAAAYVRSYQSE